MKSRLQSSPFLLPGVWLSAVPWLLFPTVAPALTAVSLVVLLLLLFVAPPRFTLPATPINSYVLLFLLLTGAAYLVSPLPLVSLPKLTVTILGAITFFLILPPLNDPNRVERLAAVLAVCAGLVALAGFFTLEWPERQIINLEPITDRLPHLSGSFSINYNEMAGTLLMLFPFVLAALRKADGRFKKIVFSLHLILLIVLLIFTQSRSALLGVGVISLTWLLWGRIPIRKILPVLILAALLIILVMALSPSTLLEWLSTIDAGSKQGDAPPTSWLNRLEIWQVAGQMLADYPVIGSGLYTFDPVSRANYIYETILPSFNLTHAHNLFLQAGTSLGISGMLALAGIWVTALVRLWQVSRSENEQLRRLSAVFAAATVGYLFFNLFDTITFGQKPGIFAWLILAGSMGLSQLAGEQAALSKTALRRERRLTFERLAAFVPFLVFIILLLSPALPRNLVNLKLDQARLESQTALTVTAADFPNDPRRAALVYYLAGDEVQALNYWRLDPQSTHYLQLQGMIALTDNKLAEALSWFNLNLALVPNSAEAYLWRGVVNETRGTLALAEADYRKAIEYSAVNELDNETKAYIFYRLGQVLAENKNWPDAAGAFAQAASLEPDSAYYYQRLGDVLAKLGDPAAAEEAYQRAEDNS
jgi:O-antigen ligase/Flp pilus assembly protein TadD